MATTTKVPAKSTSKVAKSTPAKPTPQGKGDQGESKAPKLVTAGRWDTLAYWAVIILMEETPALKETGVTDSMVATFLHEMKAPVFKSLQGVQAIPQGVTLKDLQSIPPKGEGGWARKLANTLWRMCPSTPGDKQAGGGKYSPALLIRHSEKRPVTFTLA